MKYGILDTTDGSWVGNDKGPLVYEGEIKGVSAQTRAKLAAQILNEQFKTWWRFRMNPWLPEGPFKLKDTIEAKLSFAEALAKLEGKNESGKD